MPIFSLLGNNFSYSPTTSRWWGYVLLVFVVSTMMAVNLTGCASTGPVGVSPVSSASLDSLGLGKFLTLPEAQRFDRQRQAQTWIDRAANQPLFKTRSRSLAMAAGLAPDNPDTWLKLAQIQRWIGDYLHTSTSLENAALAVRKLDSSYTAVEKRDAQRRTALAWAWLHYDRAEYREAMRWIKAGEQVSGGDKWIRQIRGLVEGSLGNRSQAQAIAREIYRVDVSDPDGRWVLSALERSQGLYLEAFNFISSLRPDHPHSAEFFRDRGEVAEYLGEWNLARQWYAESFHALPFNDTQGLTEISHSRLEPGLPQSDQPFWLAQDRFFVTGSLSSFAAFALQRFDSAADPPEKEFWAGQVVDSAGILLRKEMHRPWTLRARGMVFAEKGLSDRGLKDLRQASRLLVDEGKRDARVEALIGHLLLIAEDQDKAMPRLREAVAIDPGNAEAWSDLGLCLIMDGDRDEANRALTTAIELKPDLAVAWYNRGLMNLHQGNLSQAETDLEQAAQLAPGNTEVAKLLQQVHFRRRQK